MKKIILAASAAMFCISAVNAQVSIAPEAGVNLSSYANYDGDVKMKPGLRAGVNVNFPITSNLYVQPGVFFSQKGATAVGDIFGIQYESSTTLNYIEVPVNLMYRYPMGVGALMFSAGPYFAYAMSGKYEQVKPTSAKGDITFSKDAGDHRPSDIGFNAGVGYELPMGLYLRAQYGMGFTNLVNEYQIGGQTVTPEYKNSNIQLSIGYNLWTWNR